MTYDPRIYRDVFYPDGMLLDIFVRGTTVQDCMAFLEFSRGKEYEVKLNIWGDRSEVLPENVEDLSKLFEDGGGTLHIDPEHLDIIYYLRIPEEIECTIDPQDFQNDEQVTRLLEFIRGVGRRLDKPVDITPESAHRSFLYRFDPETDKEYWDLLDYDWRE